MSQSDKPLENWPQCPYPKDIFPMNTKQYVHAIPDLALRTAVSGHMARFGWKVAEHQFLTLFEESKANLEDPIDIREIIQCLTDSNALLIDTQQAYGIFPDKYSDKRQMICAAARAAYNMGRVPYDPV